MRPMSSWRIWLMPLDWTRRNKHSYLPCCISLASLLDIIGRLLVYSSSEPCAKSRNSHCQSLFFDAETGLHCLHMSWPHWTPHSVDTWNIRNHEVCVGTLGWWAFGWAFAYGDEALATDHAVVPIQFCRTNFSEQFKPNLSYFMCITFLNSSYYQTNQKNPGTMGPLLSSCWKLCFFVFFLVPVQVWCI